ncbi:metal ABC transporter permease [Corynebacterium epidermidicanis]|uniref:High-affinity zinc uptake system membrane protein ZnuB n=1 Tax=Corynebacterium epidermidicanis TaxID=1050174 RepID=A0A0G3GMF0_9CORY|nr:metal ABC transporter permease [Corynebacterium epidermidicanis]AKK02411.1 ABC-type Mn2+/Zn2+ transport system, permease component [Corynebacterium epidermidicanis]
MEVQALFTIPYLYRPLILLLALGISAGCVGALVNLRQAEFTAETMAHAIFPGVVLGFIVNGISGIIPGGFWAGLLCAAVLTVLPRTTDHSNEAGTAVILATFYAVGMVISLAHADRSGQLEALMFGRLLELSPARLQQSLVICGLATITMLSLLPAQVSVAFDRTTATIDGIRPRLLDAIFNFSVAATVAAGASAVGVLLVVGYLVIPAAAGRILCRTVGAQLAFAVGFASVGGLVSMLIVTGQHSHPVSAQACVIMVFLVLFGLAIGWVQLRHRVAGGRR